MNSYPKTALNHVHQMTALTANNLEKTISFQGAPGANSHIAALQYEKDCLPLPCFSFEDAIDAVKNGDADRAIIPIENSLHGRVADIHFLLPESGLYIIGEHFMPIHHCLIGHSKTAIFESAMSHPQALGQCRKYLRSHDIIPIAYADTAAAAAYVADAKNEKAAAIAPSLSAKLYGLEIIQENIEDSDDNMTRFVILSREALGPHDAIETPMTTLTFEVKNIPAALYKAMGGFATNGVNMTKLESYQNGAIFSATEFYADVEGRPGDTAVDRAIEELCFHSKWVRILGTYPQARARTVTD